MVDTDLFEKQRDGDDVTAELAAAGFDNAEEIGRGGFGRVYRCVQLAVDRTVAVKVLTGELDEDRERFLREQRAMGRLGGHPNIVDLLEVGATASGRPFLVMPYHAHGSLDARIHRNGPLPLPRVLRLGVKIAGALETAHRAGILHRNIKPGNILLTDYDEPVLTDFRIAHLTDGIETSAGTITGSAAFTAPEVLAGGTPTRASDVYGLAATLCCALTGHLDFERGSGEQPVADFAQMTARLVADLQERRIVDDTSAVIGAAMSQEPADRPAAEALGRRLQQVERDHGFAVDEMALLPVPGAEHGPARPAPPSPPPATGHLPLELTSFVGRRTQVADVKNLLAVSRLVTVTGIGGVGKTRLALRVAHKVADTFPDGVWLVELGDLSEPALLAEVVASVLGLRNRGSGSTLDVLIAFASSRDLLLVLDNCEHVIDAAAKLTESLLRTCPRLRVLATSRESLGLGGESIFALSPLTVPDPPGRQNRRSARDDAVALFAERAAAAVPGFEITESNIASVTRICARLDGLPLAIELAAARLRTMSPEQILSRLDDRYALLTHGARSVPRRQRNLQWSLQWSYDLCNTVEQKLWNLLSVFAGGFELDAAQQVCGTALTEAALLDALTALVDKSILIRDDNDGVVRFRMLEIVQEYGRQQAEAHDEYPETARRHRDWCEQLALQAEREWIGRRQLYWVARLERELPNLRKALTFGLTAHNGGALPITVALFMFWVLRGRLREGRRWLELALVETADAHTTAKALYQACIMAAMRGDRSAAADILSRLEALAEQSADPLTAALLAHTQGDNRLTCGDTDLARTGTLLAGAVATYKTYGELLLQLNAQITLGLSYALQDDTDKALGCLREVIDATESTGGAMLRSWALWASAFSLWRSGEPDRITSLLADGMRSAHRIADPLLVAVCAETSAWVMAEQHQFRRAAVLMAAADAMGRVAGSSVFMFHALLAYRERAERHSRNALGARAFEAARREGDSMNLDAVATFVLGDRADSTPPLATGAGQLTRRERQVAGLVARGLTNKAIAAQLMISPRTAEGHVEHIRTKLGFTARAQIAAWAAGQPDL